MGVLVAFVEFNTIILYHIGLSITGLSTIVKPLWQGRHTFSENVPQNQKKYEI